MTMFLSAPKEVTIAVSLIVFVLLRIVFIYVVGFVKTDNDVQ